MKRLFFVCVTFVGCLTQTNSPPPNNAPGATTNREETKTETNKTSDKAINADPLTASSAEITAGKAEIKGSLAPEEVLRVIRKSLPGMKFCYDEARKKDSTLSGKMKVSFVIDGNGSVTEVKATEGIATEMDDCVSRKFAQLKFPSPSDGNAVEVSYPLIFTAN
jgi:outer membrane biosynthesis protein TonB